METINEWFQWEAKCKYKKKGNIGKNPSDSEIIHFKMKTLIFEK